MMMEAAKSSAPWDVFDKVVSNIVISKLRGKRINKREEPQIATLREFQARSI
tara:strand:+ start:1975 stop:2130 length:156 start_codon:yes stop_codon:yes gene_type:complete